MAAAYSKLATPSVAGECTFTQACFASVSRPSMRMCRHKHVGGARLVADMIYHTASSDCIARRAAQNTTCRQMEFVRPDHTFGTLGNIATAGINVKSARAESCITTNAISGSVNPPTFKTRIFVFVAAPLVVEAAIHDGVP